jgi:hypothetical protein
LLDDFPLGLLNFIRNDGPKIRTRRAITALVL